MPTEEQPLQQMASAGTVWQTMLNNEAEARVQDAATAVRVQVAATAVRAQAARDGGVEAGHGGDPTYTTAAALAIQQGETAREISPRYAMRLQALVLLFDMWRQEGLIAFDAPVGSEGACILGWAKMRVNDPKVANDRLRDVMETNSGGIWKNNLINPTWSVYELFRKIGAKPRFRGPVDTDPGKHDMFYYKEWEFKNDETFKNSRKRLAPDSGDIVSSRRRLQSTGEGGSAQSAGGASSRP